MRPRPATGPVPLSLRFVCPACCVQGKHLRSSVLRDFSELTIASQQVLSITGASSRTPYSHPWKSWPKATPGFEALFLLGLVFRRAYVPHPSPPLASRVLLCLLPETTVGGMERGCTCPSWSSPQPLSEKGGFQSRVFFTTLEQGRGQSYGLCIQQVDA